ncbi:MAG: PQQ-binding-like beta-propeller repeat protein [Kangiellaceae bacterium]|nr:PQQ-binding-like beta-propeller repeat protein [Kangiellaceae bacterium]
MAKHIFKKTLVAAATGIYLSLPLALKADDTEIYYANANNVNSAKPHLIFIFDASSASRGGSFSYLSDPTDPTSVVNSNRFDATIDAMQAIVDKLATLTDDSGDPLDVNVGFTFYQQSSGRKRTPIAFAFKSILDQNGVVNPNKVELLADINSLSQSSNTPTMFGYLEAVRYMLGDTPEVGGLWSNWSTDIDTQALNGATATNYTPGSSATNVCSAKHAIVLSFGQFNDSNPDVKTNIESISQLSDGQYSCGANDGETCFYNFVNELRQSEQLTTHVVTPCDDYDGTNADSVCTDNSTNQLRAIVAASNAGATAIGEDPKAKFLFWNSPQELVEAIENIIDEIEDVSTSIVETGVTVNQQNRLTHRSDLYFAQFEPSLTTTWPGNLKKYELGFDANGDPQIVDQDGDAAVNTNTALFIESLDASGVPDSTSAKSFWNEATEFDGNQVVLGGAASRLKDLLVGGTFERTVYTNVTADSNALTSILDADNSEFSLDATNYATELGLDSTKYTTLSKAASTLKYWLAGLDFNDTEISDAGTLTASITTDHVRTEIGDPLHSTPKVITYTTSGSTDIKDIAFFGSNEGYLHAIDIATGKEVWSFIPKLLLPKMKDMYRNDDTTSAEEHLYGLDGEIALYFEEVFDENNPTQPYYPDGIIDEGKNDKAYLFVGMRRGERHQRDDGNSRGDIYSNYYALDVSNPESPELMFVVEGGTSGTNYDFTNLAQTWAKPVIANISYDDNGTKTEKLVMVFTGGYNDRINDEETNFQTASSGNDLFIVDVDASKAAGSPVLLDSAQSYISNASATGKESTLSDMDYSIAANPAAINLSGDGTIEHIYVADVAGQIFRFDLNKDYDGTNQLFGAGGRIANLSTKDASNNTNERRFFYAPDLTKINRPNSPDYVGVSIGSGYRAHPLYEGVSDAFFSIRDYGALTGDFADVSMSGTDTGETDINGDPIIANKMLDVTNILDSSTVLSYLESDSPTHSGWYFTLSSDEKVLTQALTVDGTTLFTSYDPAGNSKTTCSPIVGGSKLYGINLLDGTPVADTNNSGVVGDSADDRSVELPNAGLAPPVQVLFTSNGAINLVGTTLNDDFVPNDFGNLNRVNWREKEE